MQPPKREWVTTGEAWKLAGFGTYVTFIKAIRARRIRSRSVGTKKLYRRAAMLELAREREAAGPARAHGNGHRRADPFTDAKTSGELEAEVFTLFEARTSPVDVVRQLKLPASYVDGLFEQWWKMKQRGQAWLQGPPPVASSLPMPLAPPPLPLPLEPLVPSFMPPAAAANAKSETAEVLSSARAAAADVAGKVAELRKATAR